MDGLQVRNIVAGVLGVEDTSEACALAMDALGAVAFIAATLYSPATGATGETEPTFDSAIERTFGEIIDAMPAFPKWNVADEFAKFSIGAAMSDLVDVCCAYANAVGTAEDGNMVEVCKYILLDLLDAHRAVSAVDPL